MQERSTKNLHEIEADPGTYFGEASKRNRIYEKAMDEYVEEVGDSLVAGWVRNADSSYKPGIVAGTLRSEKARNAALNMMYLNYQYNGGEDKTFDEFLTTPIKLYRGEHGQKRTEEDVFSAYSFDKRMAQDFAGENGTVHEIEVRPIDTLGSPRCAGEAEVMIPFWLEKKVRHDSKVRSAEEYRERRAARLAARFDATPDSWITLENGEHVPLDANGNAVGGAGGWAKGRNFSSAKSNTRKQAVHKVAQGKDISSTYRRRADKYKFEIQDVINQQGFDGKPKIVDADEFNEAVKKSGFVAQRTYAALDQEVLDAYRDSLYDGDWYVDCSSGGSRYGQGMYSASVSNLDDFNGEIPEGIDSEMRSYRGENRRSIGRGKDVYEYTETFTFSPDAKIIEKRELSKEQSKEFLESIARAKEDAKSNIVNQYGLSDEERDYLFISDSSRGLGWWNEYRKKMNSGGKSDKGRTIIDLMKIHDEYNREETKLRDEYGTDKNMDIGAYAAMKGYDALVVKNAGTGCDYTIVLNRTKCIFKRPDDYKKSA